jgi:glycosyltransferase involved in cell wall biosynthesis
MLETMKKGALIIGTDKSAFDQGSDTAARMKDYATLYGTVHLIVCARDIPGERRETAPGVTVYPCSYESKFGGLLKAWKILRALSGQIRPEVIIAQDAFMFGLVALLAGGRWRIPVVVGIYGTDIHNTFVRTESLKHRIYAVLARWVLRRATAIQTDGPETVERLREEYGAKVFFKPMFPANTELLGQARRSIPESSFNVLFVGRFVPQKNIPLLLEVIEEIVRRDEAIRFSIVGDGPEKRRFMEEVRERHLESAVTDKGLLSRTDIIDAYATHHVLLITSRYEGFPRVFMEAALTGMPIVTTQVGGVMGLVENGRTGIVVPQGAPAQEIAERIFALSKDPEMLARMSSAIKSRWTELYGGKTVLDYQRPIAEFVASRGVADLGIQKIVRFLFAGTAGFIVQVTLLYLFTDKLHLWYLLSGTMAFVFSQSTSFVLQKLWAFKNYQRDRIHYQAVLFLSTGILGVILNAVFLYLFASVLHLHYLLAQGASSFLLAFVTFYIYSSHIFIPIPKHPSIQ